MNFDSDDFEGCLKRLEAERKAGQVSDQTAASSLYAPEVE